MVRLIGDHEEDPVICCNCVQVESSDFVEWPGVLSDWLAVIQDEGRSFLSVRLEIWQPRERP